MLINPFSQTVAQAMMGELVNLIVACEIVFDSGVTRVHSGTGFVILNGESYSGIGILGQVGAVKEQNTTSPTQLNLTLAGLDTSMLSIFLNENCVGKFVSMRVAALDDDFNVLDSDLVFKGKIRDTAVLAGKNSAINVTVSNIFEEWANGKSWRYTDESQRKKNNDDRIFRYVSQMSDRSIYWGSKKDAPPFTYK